MANPSPDSLPFSSLCSTPFSILNVVISKLDHEDEKSYCMNGGAVKWISFGSLRASWSRDGIQTLHSYEREINFSLVLSILILFLFCLLFVSYYLQLNSILIKQSELSKHSRIPHIPGYVGYLQSSFSFCYKTHCSKFSHFFLT